MIRFFPAMVMAKIGIAVPACTSAFFLTASRMVRDAQDVTRSEAFDEHFRFRF